MEGDDGTRRSDIDESIPEICCCLCGDIGFANALLRCHRCGYRLQHTYCSRFYPDKIDKENWGCEWCIHQEEEEERKKTMKGNGGVHNAKGSVGPKKSSKAVDRWRKLARAAKLGSGRRYKLLADVLCS